MVPSTRLVASTFGVLDWNWGPLLHAAVPRRAGTATRERIRSFTIATLTSWGIAAGSGARRERPRRRPARREQGRQRRRARPKALRSGLRWGPRPEPRPARRACRTTRRRGRPR